MARGARLSIAGGVYHVMNRGWDRRDIVQDDVDRQNWMRLLNRVALRNKWRVFAFALLNNHFHLFLKTPIPNLSEGMHDFLSGYVSLFNRLHNRDGPLFKGRFKSILVENEAHCWELTRYVHLNPTRANYVVNPAEYRWCSYRYYLNPDGAPFWLDWQTVFAQFSQRESVARVSYKRFVEAGLERPPDSPFDSVVDGWLIGSADFIERMSRIADDDDDLPETSVRSKLISSAQLIEMVAAEFRVPVTFLTRRGGQDNAAREAAVWLLREVLDLSNDAVGELLGGVGRTAISEAFRRAEKRRARDPGFGESLTRIKIQIDRFESL